MVQQRTSPTPSFPLPLSASTALQNFTPTQWDDLMADLLAALVACQTAVNGKTFENKAWAWRQYTEYCESCSLINNFFLNRMSQNKKIKIMGVSALDVRKRRFSGPGNALLAKSSVSSTLNLVAVTFHENGREDPKRDAEHNIA